MPDFAERVLRALRDDIAPALDIDSSGVEVLDVVDGVVRLRLPSLCGCCPSTIMSVVNALEQELRKRVPEVEYLQLEP